MTVLDVRVRTTSAPWESCTAIEVEEAAVMLPSTSIIGLGGVLACRCPLLLSARTDTAITIGTRTNIMMNANGTFFIFPPNEKGAYAPKQKEGGVRPLFGTARLLLLGTIQENRLWCRVARKSACQRERSDFPESFLITTD